MKKLFAIILLAASAVQAQDITGAGATFPAPLYARWSADYYKTTGQKVNYQSIGSGAGLKQIEAKTVAFGPLQLSLQGRPQLYMHQSDQILR